MTALAPEKELYYHLKARNTLLWVSSSEESRVERVIAAVASSMPDRKLKNPETGETQTVPGRYAVRTWDCAVGLRVCAPGSPDHGAAIKIDFEGTPMDVLAPEPLFELIRKRGERAVWILRDFHRYTGPSEVRGLKTLAMDLQRELDEGKLGTLIVLSPSPEVPLDLQGIATALDWPLPDREHIGEMIDSAIKDSGNRIRFTPGATRESLIDAATGLTSQDIGSALSLSNVMKGGKFDPELIRAQKKQIINREKVLEWYEPDPRGLAAIGGLSRLKRDLEEQMAALLPEARAYGVPMPRGLLLAGPPGVGKSLTPKAAAAAFKLPLLRIDMAALKGGTVGTSEANFRRMLRTLQAVAPCIAWADELDMALAGATSEWTGDSGVSKDQLGTFLTFLQEHTGFVYLIATTNYPKRLPPALTRDGRFDARYFLDLPSRLDREEILAVAARALEVPRDPDRFDIPAIARETPDFSGAELATLWKTALRRAWRDNHREIVTDDLLRAAVEAVPVSKSSPEWIAELRAWGRAKAIPAADPEPETLTTTPQPSGLGRLIEVED